MRNRWRPPAVLGPLFGYDLVASTRRGQHTGLRVLVAALLFITLYVIYSFQVRGFDPFDPFKAGPAIDPRDMPNFAAEFFTWCMVVQFAAVLLLTPTVVADAIARDKERRALDFLFVTALTDREIVLGKLGSRLAYLVGVVMTGLPILALTQLFGGVEPRLLLGSYAALFATLVSLGALCLYCSVVSQTALQATVRAYAASFGYLLVCSCVLAPLLRSDWAVSGMVVYVGLHLAAAWAFVWASVHDLRAKAELLPPVSVAPTEPIMPHRLPVRRPQPARAVAEVVPVGADDEELPFVLPAVATLPADRGWDPAEWRALDRPALWEPPELPRPPLPPVDDRRPLLWKEVHLHSLAGSARGAQPVIGAMLILAAGLAVFLWLVMTIIPKSGGEVAAFSTGLVKVGTVLLGGVLGLGAIVHAANSVTRERERDTLDALLTLPLTRAAVLEAKWLGGPVSLRLVAVGLAGVWVFGLATGGLHPVALLALVLAVAAVVEFLASLGLWLSVVCATSLRANMAAALALLLVACGPWVVARYVEMLAPYAGANQATADAVTEALTPAWAWVRLCVGWVEYAKVPEGKFLAVLAGALGYAAAAWALWRMALGRFRLYGGKKKKI
jgi:ABC-type transport system involved in multi-copper enzyme maturation permease subunit